MATKKATKRKGVTREQIWKIWRVIGPQGWYTMAQEFKRDHNFTFYRSDVLKGRCPCPDHADTSPSFYIHVDKGYVRCFGCNFYSSNPVVLGSLLMDSGEKETLAYFREHYNINFMTQAEIAEYENQRINQLTKQVIYKAAHAVMCDSVLDPTRYPSTTEAIKWLTEERKISADVLHALPIGVLPSLEELNEVVTVQHDSLHKMWEQSPESKSEPLILNQQVFEYLKDVYSNPFVNGGVIWPLHTSPTEIARLKIRAPHSRAKKDIIMPLDPYEESLGLFGVGWEPYSNLSTEDTATDWVYLTEGEFDVLSYMAQSVECGPRFVLYSVGGTGGATEIEPILKSMGVKGTYLIGDSPNKGGEGGGEIVVREWLRKISNIHIKIFTGWSKLDPSLDLDEAVLQHGVETVTDILWREPDENFTPAWEWTANNAIKEMEGVSETDKRTLLEKATHHGQNLRNKIDIDAFAEMICAQYPLKESHLKREIASNEDTEVGFIQRCMHAILEIAHVVATRTVASGRSIILFHKETKNFHEVRLDSDSSIAQELAPVTGTLVNFVEEKVGFPTFIESPIGSSNIIYTSVDKAIRACMKQACLGLAQGASDVQSALTLRQGYHNIRLSKTECAEYIVCGIDIFKIHRESTGIRYLQLDGPSDNGIIFDIGFKHKYSPWYPGGLTLDILNHGQTEDIKELYNELVRFLDMGFKFKKHELTTKFLATLLIVLPIMHAFPRQLIVSFTGDSGSGKSHLVNVFSGLGNEGIQLLYCSIGMDDYTPPSIYNRMNGDTRLLVLDEFEATEIRKANTVDAVLQHYRGLVAGSASRTTATQDGDYREVRHEHSIIFSAISVADKAQDMNRQIVVEMDKILGRERPTTILKSHYGQAGIDALATKVATAAYPIIPILVQNYHEIEKEFANLQAMLPFSVPNRYASSLFFSLAVLKYIGEDWKAFFKDFVMQNEATINRATTTTESESYLNAMLFNPVIQQQGTDYPVSVAKLLAIPSDRVQINLCGCGMFFDADQKLLLILVEQALSKLMPTTYKNRNITGSRLRDSLERHKMALPSSAVPSSGILRKIIPYLGANIEAKDVVVLHADPWLNSAQEGLDDMAQKAQTDKEEKKSGNVTDWR